MIEKIIATEDAPLVRNLTLRLAAERIYRSNYRPLLDSP
jgi:hypothetical protein